MEKLQDYLDVAYALVTLQAVVLVPTLARIRLVYTFLWNVFTVIATKMESPTALGLAMVMGLSVMLSWYALRFFDRSVFDSMLLGWFGFISKYHVFRDLANAGNFLLHFMCPVVFTAKYMAYVEVWMALTILGISVLWVYFVADGALIANDIYHFSPPRSLQFGLWQVILSNLTVPLSCVLVQWSGVSDLLTSTAQEAARLFFSK